MRLRIGTKELNVQEFYPYRYPTGKLCLRFVIEATNVEFTELYNLLNGNQNPIEYYKNNEDEKPVCTYYDYSEFTCQYENGQFHVEQLTPSVLDSIGHDLQAKTEEMAKVINEQSQVINNQAAMIDMLTEGILDMSMELYGGKEEKENE